MSKEMPRAADLFDDADSPKKAARQMDEYLSTLDKALSAPSGINPLTGGSAPVDPVASMEALVANKSLTAEAAASLGAALASQRVAMQEVQKDISLTSPLSTSFAAFDLEAPAKLLTPRPTPLRNKIVRKKGMGTSHRVKRINGYTGTGTGGVGNIWPGITETTTTAFGSINYERGPKISYAADDLVIPYSSYSLSDSVSFDANFSGLGYQDLRQLSSTSTLYATMLMEERMMLMARGTASGFSGALAAPASVTATVRDKTGSEVNITTISGGHIYVYVTADAGAFGESVSATAVDVTVANNAKVVDLVIAPVTGALGYKVYVGTGASDPGRAAAWYAGRTATTSFTISGVLATSGAVPPAADTSAYATGYDGILPTVLGSNSGKVNRINSTFSTSNPGVEFQTVFSSLYDNVKADPDEILLNGADRKQLSDAIKNGSTANYRLNLTQTEAGDYVGGATIGALYNEITGKMVNLTVHPWLPQGVAPVLSYTLPIPDTEVSDVWANIMVQDYMGIQWPVTQFAYEFSTYFRGSFFCYAPAWNGAVAGIAAA